MGANLVQRLVRDGHRCVVYDVNVAAVEKLAGERVVERRRSKTSSPNWTRHARCGSCCRQAITQDTLNELIQYLDHDDVVIDGATPFTATT